MTVRISLCKYECIDCACETTYPSFKDPVNKHVCGVNIEKQEQSKDNLNGERLIYWKWEGIESF